MWEPSSAADKYGASFVSGAPASRNDSALNAAAGPSLDDDTPAWHPGNPLFWAGALAAIAVGAMYASTTVRVGPLKASLSAGSS